MPAPNRGPADRLTPDEIARFRVQIARGAPDECWPWTGQTNNKGYGRFEIYRSGQRVRFLAHRLAYSLVHGPLDRSTVVRHTCDNPPCCNDSHHLSGTQRDNLRDALDRGRMNLDGLKLGQGMPVRGRRPAACRNGHPYVPGGYRIDSKGTRRCSTCAKTSERKRSARRSAVRRANPSPGRVSALRSTHCPNGHPLDDVNLYISRAGTRRCRPCQATRARIRKQRAKEAA